MRRLFEGVIPPPPPSDGQADAARRYARRRRRSRTLAVAGLTAVVLVPSLLLLRGVDDDPDAASGIQCPSEVVATEPVDQPRDPAYPTPREAAVAWAGPGNAEAVRMQGDHAAELVREDGSLRARMRIESTTSEDDPASLQWSVNGSTTCGAEIAEAPWGGSDLVDCPAGLEVVRARVEVDPTDRRFTEPQGLRVERSDRVGVPRLTPGALSGDTTTVTTRPGVGPVLAVRELRLYDRWQVSEIAACLPGPPNINGNAGLPADFEWDVRRLQLGHCSPPPFELNGRTWVSRAEDDELNMGYEPPHWFGYGIMFLAGGIEVGYIDLGGAHLRFVEQGSPDAYLPPSGCA